MDRYYTPDNIARCALEKSDFSCGVSSVLDPACGSGSLLRAAEQIYTYINCLGIDVDRSAIRVLKKHKPHWLLSVADVWNQRSLQRSTVRRGLANPDVIFINPPYSQAGRNYIEVSAVADGERLRTGRAMGFLLQSLNCFAPKLGALAIIPESMLYSELDSAARDYLESKFKMQELFSLRSTTFKGARVRSVVLQLTRGGVQSYKSQIKTSAQFAVGLERGNLPVHRFAPASDGAWFIHSTHLRSIVEGTFKPQYVSEGRVCRSGWVVLLPRVGLPRLNSVREIYLSHKARLSDCVFGLWCSNKDVAEMVVGSIHGCWTEFTSLYRGTGARYLTISKLTSWLSSRAFSVDKL